jgi:hypothetical protein
MVQESTWREMATNEFEQGALGPFLGPYSVEHTTLMHVLNEFTVAMVSPRAFIASRKLIRGNLAADPLKACGPRSRITLAHPALIEPPRLSCSGRCGAGAAE